MDLSISPDLDARICYAIVFLCGLVSARFQIYQRLTELKLQGVWLVPATWLMFLIYLCIPAVLFWLLDRMGAINDTSLFAALLIGLAYPAILSGAFAGLKAPASVEAIFKPIEAFTSTIIKNVLQRIARIDRNLEDFVVGKLKASTEAFGQVRSFVLTHATDPAKIETDLSGIDENPNISQPGLKLDKKSRLLYNYLACIPDYRRTLSTDDNLRGALFSGRDWLRSPVNRQRVVIAFAVIVGISFCALIGSLARDPVIAIHYNVWRLSKAKNSPVDRFRAFESLRTSLADPSSSPLICDKVSRAVRSPDLPSERVDHFLQLMLCARAQSPPEAVCSRLVEGLRVENIETRARIHAMLLFFALEQDPDFKTKQKDLADWVAHDGDSVTSLETRVAAWRGVLKAFGARTNSISETPVRPNSSPTAL